MRRSLVVLILASMAAIAALALVSVGLSYGQAMKEKATFTGPSGNHMGRHNHMDSDGDMSSHMNVTQYMHGDMYGACEDMHDRMNVGEHMTGMP